MVFVENFTGYLLKKNSSVYVKIWERYSENTERVIYSGSPVIITNFQCFLSFTDAFKESADDFIPLIENAEKGVHKNEIEK